MLFDDLLHSDKGFFYKNGDNFGLEIEFPIANHPNVL